MHPQSLIWYHSESKLAQAFAIIVHNVAHISVQPIIIFNCENEITFWAGHAGNAIIIHENVKKKRKKKKLHFLSFAHVWNISNRTQEYFKKTI